MNWGLLLPLLITTLTAVGGWLIAHRLAARRDQTNKRRDLRIQYLVNAYRRLERASNRALLPEHAANIESAIADIQLFGSARQVEMAMEFASNIAIKRTGSFDGLLADLRQELRHELMLETVSSNLKYLRITVTGEGDGQIPPRGGSSNHLPGGTKK